MHLVYEPTVYVVGRQTVDKAQVERFLADHGVSWETDTEVAAEALVEVAGRLCYMSYATPRPGGNRAYVDHLIDVGHGSVLEHAVWSLLVTGISRSCSHELVRHRVGLSPSQLSQRYVDESDTAFVVPPDIEKEVRSGGTMGGSVVGGVWRGAMRSALTRYVYLADYLARKAESHGLTKTEARKYARQAARSVLPNATETKIYLTGNARALRHFLDLRGSLHAEPEIRRLAAAVCRVLQSESPALFGDYRIEPTGEVVR